MNSKTRYDPVHPTFGDVARTKGCGSEWLIFKVVKCRVCGKDTPPVYDACASCQLWASEEVLWQL